MVYPPSNAKANYKGVYYKQHKRKNNQGLTLRENGKKMLNQKIFSTQRGRKNY